MPRKAPAKKAKTKVKKKAKRPRPAGKVTRKRPRKVPPGPDLSHITPDLRPLARPIGDLVPDPQNARLHPQRNLDAIRTSLAGFTQRKNIVVQRRDDGSLVVRAGNGTLEAARILGWTHVAYVVVEEADDIAKAYALADNRTAELAAWSDDNLTSLLRELTEAASLEDLHLDPAWTDVELDRLVNPAPPEFPEITPDSVETNLVCPKCSYEWAG